jgi:hypothetical protein
MIYSVWNQARRAYNYFQTTIPDTHTSAPTPRHLKHRTLGLIPEQAAWPLPENARFVGYGSTPRGHIAQPQKGLGEIAFGLSPISVLIGALLGYVVYRNRRRIVDRI